MSDVLRTICADTRAGIARRKAMLSITELDRRVKAAAPPRGFAAALRQKVTTGGSGLIAEIKRASPSAGLIRADFNPAALAQAYAAGGAACLSVLTDIAHFQGRDADLAAARAACALPVLRKDFMLDVWQVAAARAIGADCILLIMAALDDAAAAELHAATTGYGMDVLIEVHDRDELDRALRLPGGLLGINNRNLKTLQTDLAVTESLSAHAPPDRLLVSESGIASAADITRLRKTGAHCFLVGESLLKQPDVTAATRALLGV